MKPLHKIARLLQPAAFALFLAFYLVLHEKWPAVFWTSIGLVVLAMIYEMWMLGKLRENRKINRSRYQISLTLKAFIVLALALRQLNVPYSFFVLLLAIVLLFGWNVFLIFNKRRISDPEILDDAE